MPRITERGQKQQAQKPSSLWRLSRGSTGKNQTDKTTQKTPTCLHTTSVRVNPNEVSTRFRMLTSLSSEPDAPCASENAGHPEPEQYLWSELWKTFGPCSCRDVIHTQRAFYAPTPFSTQQGLLPCLLCQISRPVTAAVRSWERCPLHFHYQTRLTVVKGPLVPLMLKASLSMSDKDRETLESL